MSNKKLIKKLHKYLRQINAVVDAIDDATETLDVETDDGPIRGVVDAEQSHIIVLSEQEQVTVQRLLYSAERLFGVAEEAIIAELPSYFVRAYLVELAQCVNLIYQFLKFSDLVVGVEDFGHISNKLRKFVDKHFPDEEDFELDDEPEFIVGCRFNLE